MSHGFKSSSESQKSSGKVGMRSGKYRPLSGAKPSTTACAKPLEIVRSVRLWYNMGALG